MISARLLLRTLPSRGSAGRLAWSSRRGAAAEQSRQLDRDRPQRSVLEEVLLKEEQEPKTTTQKGGCGPGAASSHTRLQ